MLLLEAKVRKGLKPVVTIDERASEYDIINAMRDVALTVCDQLDKRKENNGLMCLFALAAKLSGCIDELQ